MGKLALPIAVSNAETATFDCSFGRGCEGVCCRQGRPSVDAPERAVIDAVLPRVLPLLRPASRALIEREGYLSRRIKLGSPMVRVSDGWCVFFNQGCTLHAVGAEDGATLKYKPSQCALFPLNRTEGEDWYVRQWGVRGEVWDVFCLNPANSARPAVESLAAEIDLAASFDAAENPGP